MTDTTAEPGETKRFAANDLRDFFGDQPRGKYSAQFRFRSPKVPPRFLVSYSFDKGKKVETYKDVANYG